MLPVFYKGSPYLPKISKFLTNCLPKMIHGFYKFSSDVLRYARSGRRTQRKLMICAILGRAMMRKEVFSRRCAAARRLAGAFSFLAILLTGARADDATVKIGVVGAFSGNSYYYTKQNLEGAQLAVKDLNAAGGILGRRVELLVEDDQDRPDVSATKVLKLIDEGSVVLLSFGSTASVLQNQRVAMEAHTPEICGNYGDTVTTKINNPFMFQIGATASEQLATLLKFASGKYHKVALITDDSATGQDTGKAFRDGLKEAGMEIVAEQTVEVGATDVTPQLQRIRAANPEAVFNSGVSVAENALFFRNYRQLGLSYPILASGNVASPAYLELAPHMLDGVYYADIIDPRKPQLKAVFDGVQREFKHPALGWEPVGYDGVMLFANAIKRAGSLDKDKIQQELITTKNFIGSEVIEGEGYSFSPTQRVGFPADGVVIRAIENNQHGPVIYPKS
jgi:branched-chain amino acid transport system substrate-binding protein